MTWNHVHRRGETLRDVVETLDVRRDGVLPVDLPGVAENFDGPSGTGPRPYTYRRPYP